MFLQEPGFMDICTRVSINWFIGRELFIVFWKKKLFSPEAASFNFKRVSGTLAKSFSLFLFQEKRKDRHSFAKVPDAHLILLHRFEIKI